MTSDGFVCQRCGGLVDVEMEVRADGRAAVEFRCGGCGLRSRTARAARRPDGDDPPLAEVTA